MAISPLAKIDATLNQMTMYRLVILVLGGIAWLSVILGFLGILPFGGIDLLFSLTVIVGVSLVSNFILGRVAGAPANTDSTLITGFILFFILAPASTTASLLPLVFASIFAIASKYLFVLNDRHIFNPAAAGLVALGLLGFGEAVWWVATPILFPATLLGGFLIVKKIRRFDLTLSAIGSSTVVILSAAFFGREDLLSAFAGHFLSWPTMFFATIMLTEPFTTPPTRKLRVLYGVFVGTIFSVPFHYEIFHNTPELTLLIGNLLAYTTNLKYRLTLKLKEKREIAKDMFEFTFEQLRYPFFFKAGQYLEWTLPHSADNRGIRRYFTIASAPSESSLSIGVRMTRNGSSFKHRLFNLKESEMILAANVAGDFVLPNDTEKKLVFIAGGIGITPFKSMVKHLLEKQERRSITLFYANKTAEDIAYGNIFDRARDIGLETIHILSDRANVPPDWKGETGLITREMIERHVPDYKDRMFYLSGPNAMVESYKKLLLSLGVRREDIVTDYFPGFA